MPSDDARGNGLVGDVFLSTHSLADDLGRFQPLPNGLKGTRPQPTHISKSWVERNTSPANPSEPPDAALRVSIVLLDGMWSFDVAAPMQVFGGVIAPDGTEPCRLSTVGLGEVARLDHGMFVETCPLERYRERPDIVVVPGFSNPFQIEADARPLPVDDAQAARPAPDALLTWLRAQHERGAELVALGTGTFVLGWAGLLDGCICTTHGAYADGLARQVPAARIDASRLIAHDKERRIWTSAGGASCVDVCLTAFAAQAGMGTVGRVERIMNLAAARPADAEQDAVRAPIAGAGVAGDLSVRRVEGTVRQSLSQSWTTEQMAWYAGMSVRTFQRHFKAQMGMTPSRWLVRERVRAACELLELTDLSIEVIAARVGLCDAAALRRGFSAMLGTSPSAYRAQFRRTAAATSG